MKFVLYNGYLRKFTYAFLTLKFLKTGRFAEYEPCPLLAFGLR